MYIVLLFMSSLLLTLFYKDSNAINIYNAYSDSVNYTLFHYIKDSKFHTEVVKNFSDPRFVVIFVFLINVIFWFKIFIYIIIMILTFKYILKIFLLKYKYSNEELKLYKIDYHIKNNSGVFDILVILPFKISNWVSFVLAYSICNCIFNKSKIKIEFSRILNSILFILVFGTSWWILLLTYDMSKSFIDIIKYSKNIYIYDNILKMIVYTFTQKFNFFLNISKMLRIYRENNTIIFNMKKTTQEFQPLIGKILTPTKNSKNMLTHPGLKIEKTEKTDTSLQFTGKLPAELSGYRIEIKDYKKPYNYCVYNVCRHSNNFEINYRGTNLVRMGINNQEKLTHFLENTLAHRTIIECGFKYEGETISDNFFFDNVSFTRGILIHKDVLQFNDKILKIYSKTLNNWDKIDKISQLEITHSLRNKEIYDYFNNDYKCDNFDFIKDKIVKDAFKELNDII